MTSPFTLNTTLSEEAKQIAKDELRETPEIVAAGLKELKELLAADTTMHYKTDDDFLTIFLRPTKWYAKSAFELMQRIAKFRDTNKELFDQLLPEHEMEAFIHHNVVNVLTNRDHKGRRILVVNCGGTWEVSKVSPDQLLRILYLIHVAAMLEPDTQVRGAVVVMDYKGLGMRQVTAFTPAFSRKLLTFIQDAMPLRLKEIHMVNNPMIFSMVWKIFKPLIREKLNKRIFFHESKMASLHKHIPPSHLPKDYDGELPAINYTGKDWYPVIEEHIDHVKKWNSCGLNK